MRWHICIISYSFIIWPKIDIHTNSLPAILSRSYVRYILYTQGSVSLTNSKERFDSVDKNFFVHYILQYTPSSGVHFGIDVYLNRWDLLILLCIQRRMLTKKIGQSTFSCFLSSSIFLYVCMKDVVLNDKGYVSYINPSFITFSIYSLH